MMEIYKKLQEARRHIKTHPMKKAGFNKFSGYDYFTPEQINSMVWAAEEAAGLIHIFNLEKLNGETVGRLEVCDVETGESLIFNQLTAIPEIKATNAAQQVGGAVTYTLRYMLMTAFDISDNSLDFDGKDNRKQEAVEIPAKARTKIPAERFQAMVKKISEVTPDEASAIIAKARNVYTFTEEQEMVLIEWETAIT